MRINVIICLLAVTLLGATGTALAQYEHPASSQEKQAPRPAPKPTPAGARDFGQEKKKCPCDIV
ncbi:MAG TPA: hypothetical protein VGJ37_05155, partial [Pyrinomonadaceae bacterium]